VVTICLPRWAGDHAGTGGVLTPFPRLRTQELALTNIDAIREAIRMSRRSSRRAKTGCPPFHGGGFKNGRERLVRGRNLLWRSPHGRERFMHIPPARLDVRASCG
jgi:hypothetical protein